MIIKIVIEKNPKKQKCLSECSESTIVNGKINDIVNSKKVSSYGESLEIGTKYFSTSVEIFRSKIWNPINIDKSRISKLEVKNLLAHFPRIISTISWRLAALSFLDNAVIKIKLRNVAMATKSINIVPIEIPHKYKAYGSDRTVPSNNVAVILKIADTVLVFLPIA
jgi:hypothetical protein